MTTTQDQLETHDRPVRDFVSQGSFVTLITTDPDKEQRGRPLTVQEEFDGLVRFLVSLKTGHLSARQLDAPRIKMASKQGGNRCLTSQRSRWR